MSTQKTPKFLGCFLCFKFNKKYNLYIADKELELELIEPASASPLTPQDFCDDLNVVMAVFLADSKVFEAVLWLEPKPSPADFIAVLISVASDKLQAASNAVFLASRAAATLEWKALVAEIMLVSLASTAVFIHAMASLERDEGKESPFLGTPPPIILGVDVAPVDVAIIGGLPVIGSLPC